MSEEHDRPAEGGDEIDLGAIDPDGNPIEPEDAGEDPAPEPESEPEPEPEPERPRRQRPGEQERWAARAERVNQLETQNAELIRRIAALENRPAQPAFDPQAAAREEQAFRESLQNMLPHEAALAVDDRRARITQQQLAQVALANYDRTDTADFRALRAVNRTADRLGNQVEQMLAQRRQSGDFSLGRRDILAYLIGQEVLSRPAAATQQQRRQAMARVASQTTRPASARGDVAGGTRAGNQQDADEALLRGITTADI